MCFMELKEKHVAGPGRRQMSIKVKKMKIIKNLGVLWGRTSAEEEGPLTVPGEHGLGMRWGGVADNSTPVSDHQEWSHC